MAMGGVSAQMEDVRLNEVHRQRSKRLNILLLRWSNEEPWNGQELPAQHLDPQRATERPAAIVRLGAVVIHEDMAKTAITKERAAQFSNVSGSSHPTRRFRIELAKLLQLSILFFR